MQNNKINKKIKKCKSSILCIDKHSTGKSLQVFVFFLLPWHYVDICVMCKQIYL